MKIFLLKSSVTDELTLGKGIELAKQQCANIGLPLEFIYANTSKKFTSIPVSTSVVSNGYIINSQEIFDEAKLQGFKFDIDSVVCLVYSWKGIIPQPTNPAQNGINIQLPCEWYMNYPNVFSSFLLHELCHYFFSRDGKLDITENYDPAFSQRPRDDWYLYLLKQFVTKPVNSLPVYKYFKPSEIVGLRPELVSKLDQAREYAGVPFKITSGFRTPEYNAKIGGVNGSEHTFGLGCDILADTSEKRLKIVSGAIKAGFNRIGCYLNHIHLGVSSTHPQNVLWVMDKD